MNTKFRRWAARMVGVAAMSAALTVGLGAGATSASAQRSTATHVSRATPIAHPDDWSVEGYFYTYADCYYFWYENYRQYDGDCYYYSPYWYLYVYYP